MNTSHDPARVPSGDASEAATVPSLGGVFDGELTVEQADPPGWPAWQRVLFRYLLCHCLLYSLPRPLSLMFGTLGEGLSWLAAKFDLAWLREEPFTWPRVVAGWLGQTETWWQTGTVWLSQHGLTPVEVLVQPSGSGDTAHDHVKLACIVALSLLLTTVWSLLAGRARSYPRLGRWLHLFARWDLAFWLLTYGLIKLYAGQFGTTELSRLTQEVGDKSPMGLVWLFLASSRPYELFGGLGEVLGGLLLFHRRTALLGCFVSIAVLANVCALNWFYDVPVKLFSTHLLLYAVFLLAPWRERLWALFVRNTASAPVDLAVVARPWLAWALAVFGWGWVACHLVEQHYAMTRQMARMEERRGPQPELYGVWNVEKMLVDGVEVPRTDATRWQFLAIDRGKRAWAREATGATPSFTYGENLAAGTVTMQPQAGGDEQAWTVERGSKTVQELDPAPRTMADYSRMVDVTRRTLVLKGKLGDKQLELHTVERVFRLHRGFHLVQELPYHR